MQTRTYKTLLSLALFLSLELAKAAEFEKLGAAIASLLGTKQAYKKTVKFNKKEVEVFYNKGRDGKATKFAVVQKGIYEPNCTHTWVVGLDAHTAQVEDIRVVEMSCPHAFPTNTPRFLEQYKGRSPASTKALKKDIHTIAKATGSSHLTTDAVITAIDVAKSLKGKI